MEFYWLGWVPAIIALFITIIVIGILVLLYKAMQVISKAYENKFQSRIAKPIFCVMAYSLIWINFKQLITFKFVVLTNPLLRDYLEITLSLVYVVLVLTVLFKVMKNIQKDQDLRAQKARAEFAEIEDRFKYQRDL